MPPGLASNGCPQPKRPAPKWAMPIHAPDKLRSHSKSQDHCAALLAAVLGPEHVLGGLCGTFSWVAAPGKRSISAATFIKFGELDNRRSERAAASSVWQNQCE